MGRIAAGALVTVAMAEETSQKRARKYDDRIHRVTTLIDRLIERGIVPRSVELDGVRVDVAAYDQGQARPTVPVTVPESPPASGEVRRVGGLEPPTVEDRPVSHRQRAREDLRKRIAEAQS
jgi:hypothetical protein